MELIGYIASFAMGITLGLMGGGGSILTVPILVYLFGIPPSTATGYSLFIVGTTALIGSVMYIRKNEVSLSAALWFAVPSIVGVNISRGLILPRLPQVVFQVGQFTLTKDIFIMVAFAGTMVAAARSMLRSKGVSATEPNTPPGDLRRTIAQGLLVGSIAGFVGAGGGFLIIPVLVFYSRLGIRTAVGTSLIIIALQSLFGFAGDLLRGALVNWNLLASLVAIAAVGTIFGYQFSQKTSESKLKFAFGWFVLIMGGAILIQQLRGFLD